VSRGQAASAARSLPRARPSLEKDNRARRSAGGPLPTPLSPPLFCPRALLRPAQVPPTPLLQALTHDTNQTTTAQKQTKKPKTKTDKLIDDPTFRKAPRGVSAVLDDSASTLFVTEVFRGMAYTLKAFFDPKLTINYPFEKGAISESPILFVSSWRCGGPCPL